MKVVHPYKPPVPFRNGHLNTIFPTLFRKVQEVTYDRERITTPDGDFLDIDWSRNGSSRLALVIHGLEGDSRRAYVKGMVRVLNRSGWDVAALNLRGCSGEPNRKVRFYHSGATEDVETVVEHLVEEPYTELSLIGFSLGGNLVLKYLGERGESAPRTISGAVAISVPLDLLGCADELERPGNFVYRWRFLSHLWQKVRTKAAMHPGEIDTEAFRRIRTLRDFDDYYTAPIHGFDGANDYYRRCSSKAVLPDIARPTLILNAQDDPFLSATCYPVDIARRHPLIELITPRFGGHVGFVQRDGRGHYWSEEIAALFLSRITEQKAAQTFTG